MRRIFTIILIALSLLALWSCDIFGTEHTHEFGEWTVIKEATCTEDGSKTRSCSCGESEKETLLKTGHTEETVAGKKATCTEAGFTEGKKCTVCGETTVEQEEIVSLGHDCTYTEETDENGNITTLGICQRKDCNTVIENPAGLYDAENKLLASWDELVNVYGLDVEAYYLNGDYEKKETHVTYILNNNEELKKAKKLIVGDSVTQIGRLAFEHCTSLIDIVLPDTLSLMYGNAFNYCESLKRIVIPEGIKCLPYELFQYCVSLEYVYLPASTVEIDYYLELFVGCASLKKIEVSEESLYFKTIDGNLYSKDGKCLIKYATGKEDKEFTLPEEVTEICSGAFSYSSYLTAVHLHNNITTIYGRPFSNSLSIDDVYYNGTEEEWEALNIHDANYYNDVVFHYDGIDRFMTYCFAGDFGSSGSTGIVHLKIDNEKTYIKKYATGSWTLYDKIDQVNNLNIQYTESLSSSSDIKKNPSRVEVLMSIQTLGELYLLRGINDDNVEEIRIVCYIDGVIYILVVTDINEETNTATVNRITYAKVDLEDYYGK